MYKLFINLSYMQKKVQNLTKLKKLNFTGILFIHVDRFRAIEIERGRRGEWCQSELPPRFKKIVTLKFGSLPSEIPRLVSPDDFA